MNQQASSDTSLVLSYLGLRKAVGIIGTALPFVLAIGNLLFLEHLEIQASISAYYHTHMRNVLVGKIGRASCRERV